MVKTGRYKGLIFLRQNGFPVPDFMKVESINQLSDPFFEIYAPYGWTVRTCKKSGINEMSLFYKNKISKKEVIEILSERLLNNPDEFYIAYHSWNFYLSFNLIKERYTYIIEGKRESQKKIAEGEELPHFSLEYNRLSKAFTQRYNFSIEDTSIKYILKAIQYMELIYTQNKYYSEVAVTKDNELFFYELWVIDTFI
jgi:hypothetical protein